MYRYWNLVPVPNTNVEKICSRIWVWGPCVPVLDWGSTDTRSLLPVLEVRYRYPVECTNYQSSDWGTRLVVPILGRPRTGTAGYVPVLNGLRKKPALKLWQQPRGTCTLTRVPVPSVVSCRIPMVSNINYWRAYLQLWELTNSPDTLLSTPQDENTHSLPLFTSPSPSLSRSAPTRWIRGVWKDFRA